MGLLGGASGTKKPISTGLFGSAMEYTRTPAANTAATTVCVSFAAFGVGRLMWMLCEPYRPLMPLQEASTLRGGGSWAISRGFRSSLMSTVHIGICRPWLVFGRAFLSASQPDPVVSWVATARFRDRMPAIV